MHWLLGNIYVARKHYLIAINFKFMFADQAAFCLSIYNDFIIGKHIVISTMVVNESFLKFQFDFLCKGGVAYSALVSMVIIQVAAI